MSGPKSGSRGTDADMTERLSRLTALYFIAVLTILQGPAVAQQLPDPETMRRLLEQRQQQQGDQQQAVPSPLDAARNRDLAQPRQEQEDEDQGRKRARPLSPIERDYNIRLGFKGEVLNPEIAKPDRLLTDQERADRAERNQTREKLLRQFGYDMFDTVMDTPSALVGRLSDSYRLGVGDEIVITFVGSTSRSVVTTIDREGRIVVSDLPPVAAAGRTFGEFKRDFEALVARSMLGTEVYLSVGSVRQFVVTLVGAVGKPGVYQVGSQTDLMQLLSQAGGISRSGSLRRIAIRNGEELRAIDLYDLLSGQAGVDITLRDGDRVVVPLIGETIAVHGDVVRPAIYEQRPGRELTVSNALAMAGGALRPRGFLIERNRIDDTGLQRISGVTASDTMLSGDLLRVAPERANRTGTVELVGHVRQPGVRSLDVNPGLSALLKGGDALLPAPYLLFAVIESTDEATLQRVYHPINLTSILAGAEDIVLKDQDKVIIPGAGDIAYLSSGAVRLAILSPSALTGRRACRSITELARRARQADGERLASVARSVFVISAIRSSGRNENAGSLEGVQDLAADEIISEEELISQSGGAQRCNTFFDEHPLLLPLAIEYSAVVAGAVRTPGIFPLADATDLRGLVTASGGLSLSADPSEVELTRYRPVGGAGLGAPERIIYDLGTQPLADIAVAPGSIVRIGSRVPSMEAGTVLLSGEFSRPGVYAIRKGETLLQVIERAGGISDQAFPYGAVFTRERVKLEQQESFRRTARELNNALALAMMKNDISGDSLAAASGLISSFASVEAAGRVVVEADPAVLHREPDRDMILEGGDAIFMPKRPNFVMTAGDLLNPGALQFHPGKTIEDYLDETGGFQETADEGRVFVVFPNGVAQPVVFSRWTRADIMIPPGSTIVVPKDVNPLETLNIIREITAVLSNLAVSAASIAVISSN